MKQAFFRFARCAVLLMFVAGVALTRPWELLPGHWKPWAPLRLDDPLTVITLGKLAELQQQPEACLAVLRTASEGALEYVPLEDYTPVDTCPLTNVVRVSGTGLEFSAPVTLSCPLLVRWLMFERQALQPLALQHVGSPVTRIEHYGSFACRNVYGRATGRRSEHATASAFDVAAFEFEGGDVATVLGDWDADDAPDKSAFLKELHGAACRYFGAVLGPEYNQPHENHFHLDTGRFNICR